MKKKTFIVLLAIVALTTILATYYINQKEHVEVHRINMDVIVTDSGIMGFNVDDDAFHFGQLGRGGGGRRLLKIHQVTEDVLVVIEKKGEIAGWVSNPNRFIVRSGQEINISFSIGVPADATLGNHTGEAIIKLIDI